MNINAPSSDDLLAATATNKSFSLQLPGLQTSVDSTSLGEFKTCPRKYYYGIILGIRSKGESPHLLFGQVLHAAREQYEHATAGGAEHEEALRVALRGAMSATWNEKLNRPLDLDHPKKNRLSLIRSVVWYLDEKAKNDPLRTVRLANGQPAVELSFTIPLEAQSLTTDEDYALCGHIDRLAEDPNEDVYVTDIKTTGSALGPRFWQEFSPHGQMSGYTFAGKIIYERPVRGVIIDGLEIGTTFTRCERAPTTRTDAQLQEWLRDTHMTLRVMEAYAHARHWPMNDKSCNNYGGCPFREICGRPPGSRQLLINAGFTQRVWDPLERRGKPDA